MSTLLAGWADCWFGGAHMAQAPLLTEEQRRSLIGKESRPVSTLVEKGHIRRFAEAIGDPNPLFTDEAAARRTRYGGIIAPPTFLRAVRTEMVALDLPGSRLLDAGSEWEYFEPVRPGDVITAVARVVDVRERPLRVGQALFVVQEITYTNQFGQKVATQRSTLIRY
ncbi:MAG: MaoC family dehydratase N-terminal domain-containing protein [Dehalococcoidia bacterium]|nr:MaoC family dehydratase N-terminal domain-containing protein [Dehalococcoidia bacterium]